MPCGNPADRSTGSKAAPHEKYRSTGETPLPDHPWDWHIFTYIGVVEHGSMHANMPVPWIGLGIHQSWTFALPNKFWIQPLQGHLPFHTVDESLQGGK